MLKAWRRGWCRRGQQPDALMICLRAPLSPNNLKLLPRPSTNTYITRVKMST